MLKIHSSIRVILLLVLPVLISCNKTYVGEGPVVNDVRDVGKFTKVALDMNVLLLVKDSSVTSCVVNAQGNLQQAIITRIDGNTLVITNKGQLVSDEPISIELSMNRAESFEVNGSGKIKSVNTLKNDFMDFEINGSGVMEMDVVAAKLTSGISGSGILDLQGSANSMKMEISGSGTLKAASFNVLDAKVQISGSGEAYVNASQNLDASVSGSGSVKYRGNPEVRKSISGSGSVTAAQ